ncbi:hypothetical protein FYK55_14100 [Roseiconus nitratireducens]|uniref:Uncharacterized protein n=1 Tax=Roseiconus nitratireducens TaxID=2605748 RepID=A0A5M6D594_9BACT|nr:hypothetical protein [Roseiconus nitratireducens]KAA5542661.1 hypothetical protein FYK55_14100 [Roseiconus nitratireducens]
MPNRPNVSAKNQSSASAGGFLDIKRSNSSTCWSAFYVSGSDSFSDSFVDSIVEGRDTTVLMKSLMMCLES